MQSRTLLRASCTWLETWLQRPRPRPLSTRLESMDPEPSEIDENYRVAISTLNGLQTNAAVLEQIRRRGDDRMVSEYNRMQQYLERVGIAPADLAQLNAVHVSGTKGKGSVCAVTESILRCHDFKTGLYVLVYTLSSCISIILKAPIIHLRSPHLLEVRERIRLNGQPLSRGEFVSYFWDVYSKLNNTRHLYNDAMPSYFRFLTVMAFSVFLSNKVDVAVVEVGIGGTHDSTNIIEEPVVCGITSLGYDHTDILGPTLFDIAWHKGGICKQHRPAFTVEQRPEALTGLSRRARELGASSLSLVPPLASYPGPLPELGLKGKHQVPNASLALQLSSYWLQNHSSTQSECVSSGRADSALPTAAPFPLTQEFTDGLRLCRWAGRNQVVERGNVTYYLDGAHTPESVAACAEWFLSQMDTSHKQDTLRVLLFNTTGKRDTRTLLLPLMECGFSRFVFCPNISHSEDTQNSPDHTSHMVTQSSQLSHCYANQECCKHILSDKNAGVADVWEEPASEEKTRACVSVADALQHMDTHSAARVVVLVTGSLHLIGSVMSVLGFTVEDL
ncbi:Folylpolyglutamate synthase, mitochondrial [Geodia barretti]|uniref:Folylpolyglutamate synthase n=1 Tax=Geodia barretti TaxID=519541 RepID=A0AA35SCT6_GEOBA|nr:Folylpolyglutamate synthase, mitochondrial [Geodia barretti]